MHQNRSLSVVFKSAASVAFMSVAMSGLVTISLPSGAWAQSVSAEDLESQKEYWQDRYRGLRQEIARLKRNVEEQTAAYAEANRRNYRRGKIRHVYKTALQEAQADLVRVQAEFDGIEDEGRRAGALPGWFYEIEDEPVIIPAAPSIPEAGSDADENAGRNPLYLEGDESE